MMFRNLLLGIGISLITFSLILVVVDIPEQAEQELAQEPELNQEELINRARKLGMGFPGQERSEEFSLAGDLELVLDNQPKEIESSEADKEVVIKPELDVGFSAQTLMEEVSVQTEATEIDRKKTSQKDEPDTQREEIELVIRPGMKAWEVVNHLEAHGIVDEPASFLTLINKFEIENKIMAGTYELKEDISKLDLLLKITAD